jgi:hypothetical protein
VTVRPLEFQLPRSVLIFYASLALLLSSTLLAQSLRRGSTEFSWWLAAYAALGLLCLWRPQLGPLAAGFMAFLLGWVRTYRGGINLDLGLGLIALAVGVYVANRAVREKNDHFVDLAGLFLLAIAAWSLVSLAFTVVRVYSFTPAPGFGYRLYQFNAQGFSSEEAVIRTTIGAASTFIWWGLYEYARRLVPNRRLLNVAVFLALLADAGALIVQRFFDPAFLHPDDLALIGRLNGVTSFCYALGDAALAWFLLIPAWGAFRGVLAALTVGSVAMILHAVTASGSRAALFTILVASLLWSGMRIARLSRTRRRLAVYSAVAGLTVVVFAFAWLYIVTPADQATPLGRLKDGVERQGLVGHLVATRLESYPLALRVIEEYPLSGVGVGLYLAEVSKQRALLMPEWKVQDPYLLTSYAPNEFLNVGVELGLPAVLALMGVFVCAALGVLRGHRAGRADVAVSLVALAGALLLGPAFYNSEALVFLWIIVGLAARGGLDEEAGGVTEDAAAPRRLGSGAGVALLVGAVVVGSAGHLISQRPLAVESQWKQLRWHVGMGMLPREPGGRWTRPEATFTVDTDAPTVTLRWHVGDESRPDYHAEVSFYVDGVRVERSPAVSGRIRESVLPLPAVPGRKRISVRVVPPFVPAKGSSDEDHRQLGIFIHSVSEGRTSRPHEAAG